MTTNVYDENQGVMASDSRWSMERGDYILYIDDAEFDKIESVNNAVVMFAGHGIRIHEWKQWLRSNPSDDSNQPAVKGVCICIADLDTKQMQPFGKENFRHEGGYFAGSGAIHALTCWTADRNAKKAVVTAIEYDQYSGGDVKYFDFNDRSNNLTASSVHGISDIDGLNEAILKKGHMMKKDMNVNSIPFPKAENASFLIKNHPDFEQIQNEVASGQLSASAPWDGMDKDWTDGEKADLKVALGNIFGWNK